jgi:hypothetical protein
MGRRTFSVACMRASGGHVRGWQRPTQLRLTAWAGSTCAHAPGGQGLQWSSSRVLRPPKEAQKGALSGTEV